MTKLLVIGAGYWGSKLIERFDKLVGKENVFVVDSSKTVQEARKDREVRLDYNLALEDLAPDACVIATLPGTHYEIAKQCLEAGKHVLVEKPLALNATHARELVALAQAKRLVLLTDSTWLYDSRVAMLIQEIQEQLVDDSVSLSGTLHWNNPRQETTSEGIWWTQGPHPFSVLGALVGDMRIITAQGSITQRSAHVDFTMPVGHFTVELDWDCSTKERRLEITALTQERKTTWNFSDADGVSLSEPLTGVCESFLMKVAAQGAWVDEIGLTTVRLLDEVARLVGTP